MSSVFDLRHFSANGLRCPGWLDIDETAATLLEEAGYRSYAQRFPTRIALVIADARVYCPAWGTSPGVP